MAGEVVNPQNEELKILLPIIFGDDEALQKLSVE